MDKQYTQAGRPIAVTTPLGEDVLLLVGLRGFEELSRLFAFELDLLAELDAQVEFDKLLGQPIGVKLVGPGGPERYVHGICASFASGARDRRFARYRMQVVPQPWLLTHVARSRIFQAQAVPDVLKTVLTDCNVEYRIQGTFQPRDYLVQYRETDFDFACRLMEEEGLWFYFVHESASHRMVIANTPQGHDDVGIRTEVEFDSVEGGVREIERIWSWEKRQELRTGKITHWDHCFEVPGDNLEAKQSIVTSVSAGTVTHKLQVAPNANLELYDYPGGYAQRFDGVDPNGGERASDVQKIFEDGPRTAGIRAQEEAAATLAADGESNALQFSAGHKFTFAGHFDGDGEWVLTRVDHVASYEGGYAADESAGDLAYSNSFRAIPAALPWRPRRTTPRPFVRGAQTAVVVGPDGEEIFTDKYGRVKVQFPWDRDGQNNVESSCWVRVGTMWAGQQWGAIHIPRIGQEVIVHFLEGDPDRPIIVGSVWNADQMPPYKLPDNKSQSGIKSRSTAKGSDENFNELRFEDKKGAEEIYFHAETNFKRVVENNDELEVGLSKKKDGTQTIKVWGDRTETVENGNEAVTIKKGDRTVTVETGNDTHDVKKGNRTVTVETGNDTHDVEKGNRTVTIDMGNDALTIKMGNRTTKLDLGKDSVEAMQSIEFKVGGSSLKIDQMGVTIKGMMIKVEGQVQTQVKGLMVEVTGDAMLKAKGGITMIG